MRIFDSSRDRSDVKTSRRYNRILRQYPELAELNPDDAVALYDRAQRRAVGNWRFWLIWVGGSAAAALGMILVDEIPERWWRNVDRLAVHLGGSEATGVAETVTFWAVAVGMVAGASFLTVWHEARRERDAVQQELAKLRRDESAEPPPRG